MSTQQIRRLKSQASIFRGETQGGFAEPTQEQRDELQAMYEEIEYLEFAHDVSEGGFTCGWFALCSNDATTTVKHPLLGGVACCPGCAARSGETQAQAGT